MLRCIICGRLNKYHLFIIISIVFQILYEAIYGFNYYDKIFDDVKIFHNKGHEYFSKNILIHLIFSHIGLFIIAIPFYIYENKSSKKLIEESIFLENRNRKNKKKHQNLLILLIVFLWILEEYIYIFYALILSGLEFWFLELLIIYYLTSKEFNLELYKHQKLALTINSFPLITKFIFIILSTKLEKKTSNLIYIKYIWTIPLGIIIYLVVAAIRSYVNLKIHRIILYNYVSQNKVLMIYGLMGAILTSIFCIFTSIFNCKEGEIADYFCKVSENNGNDKFIDSFPVYHNTFQGYSNEDKIQIVLEIFAIIFGGLAFFVHKLNVVLVIKYFSPVYFAFTFPILFLIRKIILIINTLFISKSFFIKDVRGINKLKFFFDMIGDILSIISFLIYSEIIELNFLGFNYHTRRLIMDRALNEPLPEVEVEDEENDELNPLEYI